MTPREYFKEVGRAAAYIGPVLAIVIALPKFPMALEEMGFPVLATRSYVREVSLKSQAPNVIMRDALIDLTIIRSASLLRERDGLRLKLATADTFDAIVRDSIDRHDQDIADIDDMLAKLRRLRGD